MAAKKKYCVQKHAGNLAQLLRQVADCDLRDNAGMTQIQRESLAEQTAAAVLGRIRAGEWALGEKLPGETSLAPQLGVGRSTIREAIRQLVGCGVLTTRQGSGVFVTALDYSEDLDHLVRRTDISSVIEARIAIEVEASALAAVRRTPSEMRTMRRAAAARAKSRTVIEQHVDADIVFHRCIVIASHNPILTELFDGFTPRSRQAMVDLLRLRGEFGSDGDQDVHECILDAIAGRNADAAAALTREHLLTLKAHLG